MVESKYNLEDWEYFLSVIDKCTDDYMYVYDLTNDHAVYSKAITEVFELDNEDFDDASMVLKGVIHPDDYDMVINNISSLQNGLVPCHNLEYRWKTRKRGYVWISCRGELVRSRGINYMIGRITEIGKKNKIDNVTGLFTEAILEERYQELVEDKSGSHVGFIMFIGIDNFKEINEKFGISGGDEVLAILADALRKYVPDSKNIFRMKGDECAVICFDETGDILDNAKQLYKNIRKEIDVQIDSRGYDIFFNISAGAVGFDSLQDAYNDLIKNLRFALHSAKLNGKNRFEYFSEEKYSQYLRRLQIQDELRKCVNNNFEGFELFYQPIFDAKTAELTGAEALIRWNNKIYGFMSPVDFIPILEESGLIIPLGKWIIETAVATCNKWMEYVPGFIMHINLSFVQIIKSNIIKDTIEKTCKYNNINSHIVFEITESIHMDSNDSVRRVLMELNDNNYSLAIDDFGTGYSNFGYMKDKLFSIVKVDRSFITDIDKKKNNYLLVGFIIKMVHEMDTKICIEGVETKEELDVVKALGADFIQGYYYGRPVNIKEFESKHLGMGEI